jgi:4'-phosphopantetheinyl transferase
MDVWQINLTYAGKLDCFLEMLGEKEKVQTEKFRCDQHSKRYVLAHAATRLILSSYNGICPQNLLFEYNSHGKPFVKNHEGPFFNLSHSNEIALCGIVNSGQIGIDIEKCRNISWQALSNRFLSEAELKSFENLTTRQKEERFFSYWTKKEAYIKAKGVGHSLPLDTFSVECNSTFTPSLTASRFTPEDVGRFRLWDLPVPAGYKAALAYCGEQKDPPNYRIWTFDY